VIHPPKITFFGASPTAVLPGEAVQLNASFENGSGVISPGDLAMSSGVPLTVFPAESTTYALTVSAPGGLTDQKRADVLVTQLTPRVGITSIEPTASPVGAHVNLFGWGFLGTTSAKINGVPVQTFSVVQDYQLDLLVPPNASSGIIEVAIPAGITRSTNALFIVPQIELPPYPGLWQTWWTVGARMDLTGSGFLGTSSVTFVGPSGSTAPGRYSATYSVQDANRLSVLVPSVGVFGNYVLQITLPGGITATSKEFVIWYP